MFGNNTELNSRFDIAQEYIRFYHSKKHLSQCNLPTKFKSAFLQMKNNNEASEETTLKIKNLFETLKQELYLLEEIISHLHACLEMANNSTLTQNKIDMIKGKLIDYKLLLADAYFDCYAILKGKTLNRAIDTQDEREPANKPRKEKFNNLGYQQYNLVFETLSTSSNNNNNNNNNINTSETKERLQLAVSYLKKAKRTWKETYKLSPQPLIWRQFCYATEQRGGFIFREWLKNQQDEKLEKQLEIASHKLDARITRLSKNIPQDAEKDKARKEHAALSLSLKKWQTSFVHFNKNKRSFNEISDSEETENDLDHKETKTNNNN